MRSEPVPEAWDDDRIDRVLQAAVSVEPSPALRARVRERIAADVPAVDRRRALWRWSLAAAAVVAVTILGWFASAVGDRSARVAAPAVASRVADVPLLPPATAVTAEPPPSGAVGAAERRGAGEPGGPPAARGAASRPASSRVDQDEAERTRPRFDPREREAIEALLAFSRAAERPSGSLALVTREPEPGVAPIQIAVIDLLPLVMSDVSEGEPQ